MTEDDSKPLRAFAPPTSLTSRRPMASRCQPLHRLPAILEFAQRTCVRRSRVRASCSTTWMNSAAALACPPAGESQVVKRPSAAEEFVVLVHEFAHLMYGSWLCPVKPAETTFAGHAEVLSS